MLTTAGRINKLFGDNGGVMLSLYNVFPSIFDTATPLFVKIEGLDVPLYCERFDRRGISGAAALFADLDTDLRATELLGLEFRIDLNEAETEEDEEFYMEDLIGFRITAEGLKGTLIDYYDNEANPLFEVETKEGRRILIPAVEEFIAHIDFKKQTIKFILPEGLLQLE